MDDLKKCPFCGGEAIEEDRVYQCSQCGAEAPYEKWNHRVHPPEVVALIGAARKIRLDHEGADDLAYVRGLEELCEALKPFGWVFT